MTPWWHSKLASSGFVALDTSAAPTLEGWARVDGTAVVIFERRAEAVVVQTWTKARAWLEWYGDPSDPGVAELVSALRPTPVSDHPREAAELLDAFAYLHRAFGFAVTSRRLVRGVVTLVYEHPQAVCEIAWLRWPTALEVRLVAGGVTRVLHHADLMVWDALAAVYRPIQSREQWLAAQADLVRELLDEVLPRLDGVP